MTPLRVTLLILTSVAAIVLHVASNWWEKAWGTYQFSEISPDGCIRVDTFHPFWVLPSPFHLMPHPDPEMNTPRGVTWSTAVFRRAYEVGTEELLGETIVYDTSVAMDVLSWGDEHTVGHRSFTSDGFPFVDSDRCADEATLKRLGDFYEAEKKRRHSRIRSPEAADRGPAAGRDR
jgi:hypothetical protein